MAVISTPEAYREYLRKKKEAEQNQSSASQTTTHKTARTIGTPEEYKKYLAEKNGTAAVKTDEEKAIDRAAFRSTVEKTLPSNRAYGNQVRTEVSNAVKAAARAKIEKAMPERQTYRQMVERDIAGTAARRAIDAQIETAERRQAEARTAQQEYERIFREESDEEYAARMSGYTQMNGIPEDQQDMLAPAMKRELAEKLAVNAAKGKIDAAQAEISADQRRIDTLNKAKAALDIEKSVMNNMSRETGGSAVGLAPGKVIANAVNGTNKVVLGELDRGMTALVPMMTDAEKETIRKLAAEERWTDIEAYADAIKPQLNDRQIQTQMKRVDELPKAGQVAYGLTNAFAAPGAYAQIAADAITGKDTDLNAGLVGQSIVSGYAREKSLENLSDRGKFLGNVGYSMADNLISMALGETGALVWLGLSAAGSSATDVLARGGTQKQALIQGTASGVTEAATEKIGLDNLIGVAKSMGKAGVKNVLKTVAKQSLAEGAEEVLSEFAGAIVDIVNMGGDSEYRQLIEQLIEQLKEQGYSEKEAVHMANYQTFVKNPRLAALAGAVSGALFGAGGAAISGVRTAQYAKGIREAGEVQALINKGLKLEPTSDGYKLAQKLESDMRVRGDTTGATISSGELVELEQTLPRKAVEQVAAGAVNRLSAEAQNGGGVENTANIGATPAPRRLVDAGRAQASGGEESVGLYDAQRNAQEAAAAPKNDYTATRPASTQPPASTSRRGERTELTSRQARRILLEQKRDAHAVSFINDIVRDAGINVKYYEQIDCDNGYYDNGTIWVNLSGADKNPINVVFRHEMIHTIKESNKTGYDELRSYVMDSADSVALDEQRAKMQEQYARAGVAFDEDVFADEMVARLGERVLTDNDVALAMAKRNPSSARGVLGWIKQTLRRLYRIGAQNQMNQFYRFDEVMKPEDLYSKENLSRVRTLLENALGATAAERVGSNGNRVISPDLDTKNGETTARLMQLGVQFPSRQPSKGSTSGTISYKNGEVNTESATDTRRSVPTGEVYRRDTESAGRGSPSGITADMTDDERAAVLGKKKIRLTEYTGDTEMTEKTVERLENARIKEAKQIFRILADKCGILNTDYTNDDIQLSFQFSNTSLNESAQKQSEREYALEAFGKMLTKLPQIAKNAVEIEAHGDKYAGTKREDSRLKAMHVLLGAFREESNIYPVQLEVKEYTNDSGYGNRLYMTVTLKNENESTDIAEDRVVTQSSSRENLATRSYAVPTLPSMDSTISVPDLIRFVNSKSGDLFRYIPDSMLSDTQLTSKKDATAREEKRLGRMREENTVANTQDDVRRSVPTGAVYQTPKEQVKAGKLADPTEKDSYKQMQADDSSATAEETNGTLQKVAPLLIPGTAGSHVGMSKDLSRNLDIAAGKSEAVRRVLRQQLEMPLYEAKKQYIADYKDMIRKLREHSIALGIRPHSEESAAVMWIGEGQRQASPPGTKRWHKGAKYETVSYTLEQLKKDFPEKADNGKYVWENIVKCERWMRSTYDEYIDRINATLEEIYPDVLERAEADLAALEAQAEKYQKLSDINGENGQIRAMAETQDKAREALDTFRSGKRSGRVAELEKEAEKARQALVDFKRGKLSGSLADLAQAAWNAQKELRYFNAADVKPDGFAEDAAREARQEYWQFRQGYREGRVEDTVKAAWEAQKALSRFQNILKEKGENGIISDAAYKEIYDFARNPNTNEALQRLTDKIQQEQYAYSILSDKTTNAAREMEALIDRLELRYDRIMNEELDRLIAKKERELTKNANAAQRKGLREVSEKREELRAKAERLGAIEERSALTAAENQVKQLTRNAETTRRRAIKEALDAEMKLQRLVDNAQGRAEKQRRRRKPDFSPRGKRQKTDTRRREPRNINTGNSEKIETRERRRN